MLIKYKKQNNNDNNQNSTYCLWSQSQLCVRYSSICLHAKYCSHEYYHKVYILLFSIKMRKPKPLEIDQFAQFCSYLPRELEFEPMQSDSWVRIFNNYIAKCCVCWFHYVKAVGHSCVCLINMHLILKKTIRKLINILTTG